MPNNVDFSQLINLDDLELFGKETIVPINGTIGTLAGAINGLSSELDGLEDNIAPTEVSPAEKAHAVGSYLFYNGNFYQVISDIAEGDTLVSEINISSTSLSDELGGSADVSELMQMIYDNHFNAPLCDDEGNEIVDDEGYSIAGDWKYLIV